MKILVTGGTGFIGSALTKTLISLGHKVYITGVFDEQPIPKGSSVVHPNPKGKYDAIFHQAANNDTQNKDGKMIWDVNFHSPIRMFETLYMNGCRKFIYASSAATYGRSTPPLDDSQLNSQPLTAYSRTKAAFDLWAHDFAPDASVVGLKYSNVYGPGESHKGKRMSMVGQFVDTMLKGETPTIFAPGDQKRNWVYIDDVVKANVLSLKADVRGVFNIGSSTTESFKEIIKVTNQILGTNIVYEIVPNPYASTYQDNTTMLIEKARTHLGYEPSYSLVAGISEYVKHLNN